MPGGRLEMEVRNRVGEGQLNEGCGAEWAQKVRCSDLPVCFRCCFGGCWFVVIALRLYKVF